jgi:multidrug efflux pump subunit AcrB
MFVRIPLTLFFMIKLLMTELRSFSRLFLVLSVVPMRLTGIIAALLTLNRPLGFVAIPGVLALLGLIARHAVILVEQIETERQERSGA